MVRKVKPAAQSEPNNRLKVFVREGDDINLATAAAILAPDYRHALTTSQIHKALFGKMDGAPDYGNYADAFKAVGNEAHNGNLKMASELLASQALTLDSIFTEMARRMALNMGEYLAATETYARIAMKAQAQSRATLEALAKLHQPREQTVRHVHVNEGGQAVIADQFHHHTGGHRNAETAEQSHTTGPASASGAMLGADPFGNGVPIPSCERAETVPNARGHESWST